jgi:fucose permease
MSTRQERPPAAGNQAARPAGSAGRPAKSFDGLALGAFVALGLPDGMIGTAWPSVRHGFHVPLDALGIVLLVGTCGAIASASVGGLVLAHLGIRRSLTAAATMAALGALGIALSPVFWLFVASGTAIGVAAGLVDSGVNTAVALANRNRLLNLLHGCYGVGTSIGPLVITAALLAGSWRPGYALLLVVQLSLATGWWLTSRREREQPSSGPPADGADGGGAAAPPAGAEAGAEARVGWEAPAHVVRPARMMVTVGLGLLVFMVYTGMEVAAGQWEPSFDRGLLHMGTAATGLATFGYWGALTLMRFAFAAPRRPISQALIVRWGSLVALVGAAVVWWRPATVVTLVGLVVIGGALAGVFPALVALTPARVGSQMAPHVMGWQVGAANVGGAAISALFGAIFQHFSLADFGPALVVVAVLLVAGAVVLERAAPAQLAR